MSCPIASLEVSFVSLSFFLLHSVVVFYDKCVRMLPRGKRKRKAAKDAVKMFCAGATEWCTDRWLHRDGARLCRRLRWYGGADASRRMPAWDIAECRIRYVRRDVRCSVWFRSRSSCRCSHRDACGLSRWRCSASCSPGISAGSFVRLSGMRIKYFLYLRFYEAGKVHCNTSRLLAFSLNFAYRMHIICSILEDEYKTHFVRIFVNSVHTRPTSRCRRSVDSLLCRLLLTYRTVRA